MSPREYLFSLEFFGIKLGLDQIRALVATLGHPDRAYPSIVIAGTNGKGSTAAMVERALRAQGYRTGRYTSPHLVRIEERFCIDGDPIAPAVFDAAAARVRAAAATLAQPPSFFEATTALALDVFRESRVNVAVLEVGLGGRLDATNVVTPIGVAITSIDFDHEQYLGDTLALIAREKAGVIKPGTVAALADNPPVVESVIEGTAAAHGATLARARDVRAVRVAFTEDGRLGVTLESPRHVYRDVSLALRGHHQVENARTAVALLEALDARGPLSISASSIRTGLEQAEWPARLELIDTPDGPVLIDGAHNPAGAARLASYVHDVYRARLPIVMGVMRDKNIAGVIAALRDVASHFVFTAAASARAATPDELVAIAATVAPAVSADAIASPIDAVRRAHALGSPVVVAGSLYLAGEVRSRVVS